MRLRRFRGILCARCWCTSRNADALLTVRAKGCGCGRGGEAATAGWRAVSYRARPAGLYAAPSTASGRRGLGLRGAEN
jgi:hypothetical protein